MYVGAPARDSHVLERSVEDLCYTFRGVSIQCCLVRSLGVSPPCTCSPDSPRPHPPADRDQPHLPPLQVWGGASSLLEKSLKRADGRNGPQSRRGLCPQGLALSSELPAHTSPDGKWAPVGQNEQPSGGWAQAVRGAASSTPHPVPALTPSRGQRFCPHSTHLTDEEPRLREVWTCPRDTPPGK